jgi:hypothetical protein
MTGSNLVFSNKIYDVVQWRYLKPRHALRSIYHVFSLICFLQLFEVSASLEMASIAA